MLRGWVSSELGAEGLQVHLALTWVRGAEAPPSLFRDQAEEGGSGSSGLEQNTCSVYEAEVQGPELCLARLDCTLGSRSSPRTPGLSLQGILCKNRTSYPLQRLQLGVM